MNIYVIIPIYNGENYLKQAVESVENQGNCISKIILIDDGSTDSSGNLCDYFQSVYANVVVIHHLKNAGVSKARNRGIDYVVSNCQNTEDAYIAFLDADDFWNSECIINNHFIHNMDLIAFSTILSDENGKRYCIDNQFESRELCLGGANLQWINDGHFGAVLYSLELVKNFNLRFLNGIKNNEDVIFFREATYAANSVLFTEDFLYVYRSNGNSVTHETQLTLDSIFDIPNAWERAKQWAKNSCLFDENDCLKWEKYCDDVVGQRLLENICVLFENRIRLNDVLKVLNTSNMSDKINQLDENIMAEWQKHDLFLYRISIKKLEKFHRKKGWKKLAMNMAFKIKCLKKVRNQYKYRLRRIPSFSL